MPFINLQSLNRPDFFIRHQNFEGELQKLDAIGPIDDFAFEEEDLGKDENGFTLVRFRSKNFSDRLLRHKDFRIELDVDDGSKQFREDSTFRRVASLAGEATPADPAGEEWHSYEAINFEGRFIRHRDFHLFIDPRPNAEEEDLVVFNFNRDATFRKRGILQQIDDNA